MAQSKQELAERNAKIRAEKLRENLARRKQQTREKTIASRIETGDDAIENTPNTVKNPVG
jgi:hypothetical protein